MYALNKVQIIGYLTEKPELREVGSGLTVTDLNLEVKTRLDNPTAERQTAKTFVTVTMWRKMAEIVTQYAEKNSQIFVSGSLKTESWEDDQGNKKYKTKITADDMILLSPKDGPISALPDSLEISWGINKVDLVGNLTRDPELKTTPNGNNVTTFWVATNKVWRDNNWEKKEATEFHNVVVWWTLAEQISHHIRKGRKVFVSGRLQTRSWDTPDGQKRYTTEVVATEVKSLWHAYEASGDYSSAPAKSPQPVVEKANAEAVINDIPEVKYESNIKPEDLPF